MPVGELRIGPMRFQQGPEILSGIGLKQRTAQAIHATGVCGLKE